MKQLFDSELKVMEPLWDDGPQTAAELVKRLASSYGWNKNTTYTVIKRLIEKKAITRSEPGFICTPLVCKKDIQRQEINNLIVRLFAGSKSQFVSALVSDGQLSQDETKELKELIHKLDNGE
ncbi:MAG: BlaI/MecI/CopY family transcriptional regulator [Clostridiales bacterium]|nr:BlaI/MecI/CopY family transcriptional regulator [Clostridiales bacterium]